MDKLTASLERSGNTSLGPDRIHNRMLRHLPPAGRDFLLSMYNRIWAESSVPAAWKEAVVVPILKPGKDRSLASSYRPIRLNSCLRKTMERMVNRRLVWVLENRNLLSNAQCGFRRNRSTLDYLVTLEHQIQNSFLLRQHVVAVFFDVEKAYDTTWQYGILKTLHQCNFRGRLPLFISNFLLDRYFLFRLGNVLCARYHQENGVPQGSVLSVILFEIVINRIV
jgi:hypothetical protein